jgi:eukaryotic-like serine/threonine-protein kinase
MPAPPQSAHVPEIDLDPDDLVAEPEERNNSQTRRLGSNVQAATELALRSGEHGASAPEMVLLDEETTPEGKPPSKPYLPGDVVEGKYRLTRIIGRGGMGAVWQAHNIALDIDVAIKLIRRDRTAPGAGERLLTEARAAARLMHPAIVRVFDFGETEQGDPFIAMELLHGEALSAILRRKKRLSPAVSVQTLLPVAGALASAHSKGIVHRDLKPDNIIIITDENGALVPKIVDFGIAKLLQPDPDRAVTMAGEVLGSPDYMSPEQARGLDNVGEATDVWAFSVVLYELLTGKRPFDGANYNALIASILTVEPPTILSHGIGDAALSGIVAHGLVKDVNARWPRIRDMGAALASWAVAAGIEDDLMGGSIAKQWLAGGARRLLTVMPEMGAPLRSGVVAPPGSPQWGAAQAAPEGSSTSQRPAPIVDARRARTASARRALLLVVAIVLLGVLGVAVFLLRDPIAGLRGAEAAPSSSASAPASAPAVLTASAAAPLPAAPSTTADAPSASAEPPAPAAPSSSVHPGPLRPHHFKTGPAAPRNIRF